MKIWYYSELVEKSIDELLDLLNDYLFLKKDIINVIKNDEELEDFYYEEFLMYYDININKIKNELSVRVLITD